MHKSDRKCAAYWPRQHSRSTVDYGDQLQVAYCVWTRPDPAPAAAQPGTQPGANFVFVHGSQCCKEIFEYHAKLLFDKFGSKVANCIGIDVVTHGDSALLNHDKLGVYAAWDDIARDVGLVVRDALGDLSTAGPIFFVGHSMGATVGLLLGCLEPALLNGIIALDPILSGPSFATVGPYLENNFALVKRALKAGRDSFASRKEFEDYYNTRFCRNWDVNVRKPFIPASAITLSNGQVRTKANMANQVSAYLSVTSSFNASRSTFLNLQVPTLAIYAVSSRPGAPVIPSNCESLEEANDNVQTIRIDGAHNFPFESPHDTMAKVFPFIETHLTRPTWHHPQVHGEAATAFQFEQLEALMQDRASAIKEHYNDVKFPKSKL